MHEPCKYVRQMRFPPYSNVESKGKSETGRVTARGRGVFCCSGLRYNTIVTYILLVGIGGVVNKYVLEW